MSACCWLCCCCCPCSFFVKPPPPPTLRNLSPCAECVFHTLLLCTSRRFSFVCVCVCVFSSFLFPFSPAFVCTQQHNPPFPLFFLFFPLPPLFFRVPTEVPTHVFSLFFRPFPPSLSACLLAPFFPHPLSVSHPLLHTMGGGCSKSAGTPKEEPNSTPYISRHTEADTSLNKRLCDRGVKIVLLGEMSTGKTCVVLRLVKGEFIDNSNPTIGSVLPSFLQAQTHTLHTQANPLPPTAELRFSPIESLSTSSTSSSRSGTLQDRSVSFVHTHSHAHPAPNPPHVPHATFCTPP